MNPIDEPTAPPQEPELDLRRHPRTDTQPVSLRDFSRFTRGEACPACGHADTRPSHRSPWYAAMLGLRSRRCRACRALFAQVRPAEMVATLVLAGMLLFGLFEVGLRFVRGGNPAAPAAKKGGGQLPPPVMR